MDTASTRTDTAATKTDTSAKHTAAQSDKKPIQQTTEKHRQQLTTTVADGFHGHPCGSLGSTGPPGVPKSTQMCRNPMQQPTKTVLPYDKTTIQQHTKTATAANNSDTFKADIEEIRTFKAPETSVYSYSRH